ncbi:uncharacterized protein (DUF2336 family) [Rhodothalassium salexigens DSM 2132]|uniref:Uncharacterized protein (DUF2336 family) n=1 Tax=Rhodothalassium salexigens DSM 2132 TaxID=1188247 RepID=A0A4R2PV88_RHOSA|nr:DUF2336 domain-containing protein [Rhodothalassium salexigens]MBB4209956.1 uncharacterized protein (DUF2336 family) [Rhodothalassium salexigens DSM 2132]TCP38121.1 uncharacterized protein (DUF2336 family) [Rhodothalassium salexigens DSM 2132]
MSQRDESHNEKLTEQDVSRLLTDPSVDNRAGTAEKLGRVLENTRLSDSERRIAEDIFRTLARDMEVRVRQALSESIRHNPDVPHDIAEGLARDVAEVAAPVLESSAVLTDADLMDIVQSKPVEYSAAIARRSAVSEAVSDALAETGDVDVIATLMGNDGAQIADATFDKVVDRHGDDPRVNDPMIDRRHLPLRTAERLVALVSDQLRQRLLTRHELPADVAADILTTGRERATMGLVGPLAGQTDVMALVDALHANGRLTDTIVIRALCMGDTVFFETALAKRAGIPVSNAFKLIHDKGDLAMERLFESAEIPEDLLPVARVGVEVADELADTAGDDRAQIRKKTIERVLTQLDETIDPDNFDYLINRLGRRSRTAVDADSPRR